MRLDKYLKISRLIKRRTVANEACDNGRVTLNGRIARASAEVKPGDIIGISFGNRETRVEVLTVQETCARKPQRTSSVIFLRRNRRIRRRRGKPEVFPGIPASEPAAAQADRNSELFLNYWRTALTEPEKEG